MMPRWMKWLFLGFVAYLLLVGNRLAHEGPVSAAQNTGGIRPITAKNYPALSQAMDAEHWKRAIDPDYAAEQDRCSIKPPADGLGLKLVEDAAGDGPGAACGDAITAHIILWNAHGGKSYEGDTGLTLGSHAVDAGLESGLVGIRVGGTRTLVIPPSAFGRARTSTAPDKLVNAFTNQLVVATVKRLK